MPTSLRNARGRGGLSVSLSELLLRLIKKYDNYLLKICVTAVFDAASMRRSLY